MLCWRFICPRVAAHELHVSMSDRKSFLNVLHSIICRTKPSQMMISESDTNWAISMLNAVTIIGGLLLLDETRKGKDVSACILIEESRKRLRLQFPTGPG